MKNITDRTVSRIGRLHPLQSVTLVLKSENGVLSLRRLKTLMDYVSDICIPCEEKDAMEMAIDTNDLGDAQRRTYHVRGLSTANPEHIKEILLGVEKVRAPEHGATGLISRRDEHRDEAATKILSRVLNPKFMKELSHKGFCAEGYISKLEDDTDCFRVDIKDTSSDRVISSITLDGFSGQIAINDVYPHNYEPYITSDQLQDVIRKAVNMIMQEVTS
ncbi:hypothetical protein ACFL0K_01425 [Patescibacteria group bacterium]